MKRLLCKWIPVCAMGAVLCACGGGVADGDYVGAFKEYVKSELKSGTWVLSADENLSAEKVDSIQVEILHEVTVADSLRAGRQEAIDSYVSTEQRLKYEMEVAEHNYKLDENSQFARRVDYERKLKEAMRSHGNDRNYASKIEGYKQAMEQGISLLEQYQLLYMNDSIVQICNYAALLTDTGEASRGLSSLRKCARLVI